jgi:peptidoglycan/LPS O-acetylase OafA/YrhL
MNGEMIKQHRHHELDWLRAIVVLNLIPFHAAWLILFVPGFSRIGQSFIGTVAGQYVLFISPLHMFLLFFVSGASTFIALGYRSPGTYIVERIKRLLIPLVFFMLVLFPVLAFYWPHATEEISLSAYLAFWPEILKSTFYSSYSGGPQWAHMWFVAYLLIFSLMMLPMFLRWRKSPETNFITKLAAWCQKRGAIFVLALPLILIFALLAPIWPFFRNNLFSDWGYFTYNLIAFFYGYMFMADSRFWKVIDRVFKISLLLGVMVSLVKLFTSLLFPRFAVPDYSLGYFLYSILSGLNTWFWVAGILGLARKTLGFSNAFLKYFNRISYSFYIFHLVVMVGIGYYVTRWHLDFLLEFLILSILSLSATILCCEIVKRNNWISLLFGIKKLSR